MEVKATRWPKHAIWMALGVGAVIAAAVLLMVLPRLQREKSIVGAVLTADADPRKQLPVPDAKITAEAGGTTVQTASDSSGYFRLSWQARVWSGEQVTLKFRHPDYEPLDITEPLNDGLYIAHMKHSASVNDEESSGPEVTVGNIRIRYAVKATNTINIGSTARTLEVVNTGDVPCEDRAPCSPDGKWKAKIGSMRLDAGEGQEFQNVRVACIAGPCPFTKIESDGFSRGGRRIDVAVRAWSDTVTFLVEAEVVHTMLSDTIRQAYPSIFGRDMTFTLPVTGQGPSIEAEVNGQQIVFPLGPDLNLSWASCSIQTGSNGTKLYSCELKNGYRFP